MDMECEARPSDGEEPGGLDPVAELGHRLEALSRMYEFWEAQEPKSVEERNHRQRQMADIEDRCECLRGYASTLQASSVEGAHVQRTLAAEIAAMVMDDLEMPQGRREGLVMQFHRLTVSAVKALCADPNIDPLELGVWSERAANGSTPGSRSTDPSRRPLGGNPARQLRPLSPSMARYTLH